MSIVYDITPDQGQVDEAISLFKFVGGNAPRAQRIAINRAGKRTKTLSSTKIRGQVRLKKKFVDDRLKFLPATDRRLTGRIRAESRGLLLSHYSTDQNLNGKVTWLKPPPVPKRGIRVKVKPGGSPEPVGGHFYMVLPNSRALAIVRRLTDAERSGSKSRGRGAGSRGGSIKVAYSASVSQVFDDVRDDVLPEASELYQTEMIRAINFLLRKQFPKE